jgi:hypothetical protein
MIHHTLSRALGGPGGRLGSGRSGPPGPRRPRGPPRTGPGPGRFGRSESIPSFFMGFAHGGPPKPRKSGRCFAWGPRPNGPPSRACGGPSPREGARAPGVFGRGPIRPCHGWCQPRGPNGTPKAPRADGGPPKRPNCPRPHIIQDPRPIGGRYPRPPLAHVPCPHVPCPR